MKYFACIHKKIDTYPFLVEIDTIPSAWDQLTGRQEKIKVQREAKAIPLRGLVKSKMKGRPRRDVHETRNTTISRNFPKIMQFIRDFATEVDAELGRAKLALLLPGGKVHPHIDRGEYYLRRDRYHLVLQSETGNFLAAGQEKVFMQQGELWWFNNKIPHEAVNGSQRDRIHLIFDLEPRQPSDLMLAPGFREVQTDPAPLAS